MEKIRIFLDASAISNLEQADMPKEMADMRALWEKIQQGEFDVIVSYNYKHLKRLNTIRGTQAISIQLGHKILNIVSADSLI